MDSRGNWRLLHAAVIAQALAFAGVTGCATQDPQPNPVRVEDGHAKVRAMRIVWRAESPEPERPAGGVEIDYASHRGKDSQFVPSGQNIELGGSTAYGPQTAEHELETQYLHVAYSHLIPTKLGFSTSDRIEVEALIGLARVKLDVRSQVVTPTTSELATDIGTGGIILGIAPRWRFGKYIALEARETWMSNFPGLFHFVVRESAEIALAIRPVPHVALRAGYSQVTVSDTDTWNVDSKVETRLRGPFVGLGLDF